VKCVILREMDDLCKVLRGSCIDKPQKVSYNDNKIALEVFYEAECYRKRI
jgi:hypothetical protein